VSRGVLVRPIGAARRIDQLGRVVVPVELRRILGLEDGDLLDIRVEGGRLVLDKIVPACVLCGNADRLRERNGRHVCTECVEALSVP
jgi:transcriptional pleiotropic regulator of transition state genes